MLLRCRHCFSDIRVGPHHGSFVQCTSCGCASVSTPLTAPQRSQSGRVDLWWLDGDPALDARLVRNVRTAGHLWRVHVVPTHRHREPAAAPDLVVYGRRHVALGDPLLMRTARISGVKTAMLSSDPADGARATKRLPTTTHIALPVSPARLIAKLSGLRSATPKPARLVVR